MLDSIEFKGLSKHMGVMGMFFVLLVLSWAGLNKTKESMIVHQMQEEEEEPESNKEKNKETKEYHDDILNVRKVFSGYIQKMEKDFQEKGEHLDNEMDKMKDMIKLEKYI